MELRLTKKQNKTMASIFGPADSVWIDHSDENFAQVILSGDQRVNDNSEKAIARMNKINWKDLMQLKEEGLVKNIFDDDEALFMSVPLEIARIFHYVEGDDKHKRLAQFLKDEYDIRPMSSVYDISMDVHCDAGHTDTDDKELLGAISEVLQRDLTDDEKQQWYEAKEDYRG